MLQWVCRARPLQTTLLWVLPAVFFQSNMHSDILFDVLLFGGNSDILLTKFWHSISHSLWHFILISCQHFIWHIFWHSAYSTFWQSGALLHILLNITFWLLFCILSGILFDILWGILFDILFHNISHVLVQSGPGCWAQVSGRGCRGNWRWAWRGGRRRGRRRKKERKEKRRRACWHSLEALTWQVGKGPTTSRDEATDATDTVGKLTSSTAQGGGGSFKNRKPIGEIGWCESGMAERIHWWTERCLRSPLFLSLSLTIYLPTSLSSMYLCIYLSISLSRSLSSV